MLNKQAYGTQGWDIPDDYEGGYGGGGGGNPGTWQFTIPRPGDKNNPDNPKPATKRVLFLSEAPFCVWEHNLYSVAGSGKLRRTLCLKKNGIDERGCPLCDEKVQLQYVGYFTVIDMGFVEYISPEEVKLHATQGKERSYQFQKRLLGAKKGGTDKPGVLKTLHFEAERRGGDFLGTVWDTRREGGKTEVVGNHWEYIRRVSPDDFQEYLVKQGANAGELDISEVNYYEEPTLIPKSYEDLARMVGTADAPESRQGSTSKDGASYGGGSDNRNADWRQGPKDDDIPF